jgi:hypothetical protein
MKVNLKEVTRYFTLLAGVAFLAAGIGGFIPFFTPPAPADAPHLSIHENYGLLLGLFPVNIVHNIFHFSVGVFGLFSFRTYAPARRFCKFLGITLGVLTVMGMIPQLNTVFGVWPLYGHAIWLHGIEAVIGIYLGFFVAQDRVSEKAD